MPSMRTIVATSLCTVLLGPTASVAQHHPYGIAALTLSPQAADKAVELGAGMVRLAYTWDVIEGARKGTFEWSVTDAWRDEARRTNRTIYGLLAYTVARRTSEIGLRMALGATRGNVLAMIFRHALLITTAGVTLGATVAFQIPGLPVKVATPASIAVAAMLVISLAAAYIPARRAARIEPVHALRYE